MGTRIRHGVISAVIDSGPTVAVGFRTLGGDLRWFTLEGPKWWFAHAQTARPHVAGLIFEYGIEEAGDLVWFSVIPSDCVRCGNCEQWISPERDLSLCFGELEPRNHPRKDEAHGPGRRLRDRDRI